ncbi:protein phosphatase 2C domain-containing protein [Lysinibacter sp. HNR]|uniref:PP2C family protein-serine/threonine phosphatase n=1 Tax=Lysinibacter sp. HNR TaxID=3031408 RepID=UPI002435CBB6|nr:protein phosphatase 2C domain-containing protein [Lysinibacter sp. HNR]WGD36606.1 protein phosphatase 2C domain-containing protein [Lysinibacter sp. HNR]
MTEVGIGQTNFQVDAPDLNPREVTLSWCAVTDVGHRREINEDSYVTVPPVFAVADGMGGHSAGDIASAAVVRRLGEFSGSTTVTRDEINSALEQAVEDIEINAGDSDLGTGTTVTGVVLATHENSLVWDCFNIGDSRVYQYFEGALSQITTDHSVVQHLIDTGAISLHEAETHPHSNVITRAVGFNEAPIPDYIKLALVAGQRLLICSDGLTKELTDHGIEHFLGADQSPEEVANTLLDQALANSGRDNISIVVIDVVSAEYVNDDVYTQPIIL